MIIRETGRAKRDIDGNIMWDENGNAVKIPGKLKFCQAAGWYIDEYGYAQVTMNLHNYKVTGLHTAFDAVCEESARLGLRVTGSELVGLAPKQAMMDAGEYYLRKQGKNIGVPEKTIIHTAILSLGLNDTAPFKPEDRIVEYAIQERGDRLVDLSVEEFVNELSSESPAPGGGSVSALSGALSAGLSSMVANLTFGKKEYKQHNKIMEELSVKAQSLKKQYLELIDKDTDAFNAYITAMRMPKSTNEEKKIRKKAIKDAAKLATEIPFKTLNLAGALLELAETAAKNGNTSALSDAAVSAIQAEAAAEGAWMNVMINLPTVKDKRFVKKIKAKSDTMLDDVKKARRRVVNLAKKKLA
jgi:glutamate formiminotransferase/formiminotetrahydrofolate cyclodeaminase